MVVMETVRAATLASARKLEQIARNDGSSHPEGGMYTGCVYILSDSTNPSSLDTQRMFAAAAEDHQMVAAMFPYLVNFLDVGSNRPMSLHKSSR